MTDTPQQPTERPKRPGGVIRFLWGDSKTTCKRDCDHMNTMLMPTWKPVLQCSYCKRFVSYRGTMGGLPPHPLSLNTASYTTGMNTMGKIENATKAAMDRIRRSL